MATQSRRLRQRGMAIVFYATMLIFVIGCVGLAVDVGTIYMIKARLSSAVDAAALAGGRAVNFANDVATATTNFNTTANQFFTANFPAGYFNSLGTPTVTPSFSQETDGNGNPSGVLDFKVTASVTAPTYFMNVFNIHNINVASTGTASRRGLVLMMVLDISSSMGNGPGSSCAAMIAAAQNFTTLFSPFDQIGLVTFDITAHPLDSPTTNHTQVSNDIANIAVSGCGSNTNTISALEVAYQQIRTTNLPLALNTIVLFTDGSPNGITANFPARTAADSRYGPALGCDGNGLNCTPAAPAQSPSNACADGSGSPNDANGHPPNQICVNMPVVCAPGTVTFQGTLAQWADQNSFGSDTYGLAPPTDGASVVVPNTCLTTGGGATDYVSAASLPNNKNMRQFIGYIPDTDLYGNSLKNGVPVAGGATSPYGTVVGGYDTRQFWLFQVNQLCEPANPSACKNTGGPWANFAAVGTGFNTFRAGANNGFLRPDQPNTIVAAGMNGTMSEAFRIRADNTYNPVIHTIYLTGNGNDSVDHEFLAIVANAPQITALPYDPLSFVPYANPAYRTDQLTGKYLVTSDRNALAGLFAQLASEVLRLSH